MIAVLGLVSAVVYGASDFFGGLSSRRMSALLVSFLGSVVAVVIVAVAVLATAPEWSVLDVVLGGIAGLLGAVGTWAFYTSLAIGPMSIVSPGVAMIYAVIPAVFGITLGERLSIPGYVALVVVVIAALLLAFPRQSDQMRITPRTIAFGTIAGLGYAGYIIVMDRTRPASGLVPLLIDLVAASVAFGAVLLVNRARSGPHELRAIRDRSAAGQAVLAGVLLAIANILLVIGLHLGDLAVMGVLNSLYPLGTVLLAFLVLRERLSVLQIAGIVLAVIASVTLALS